MKTLTGNSYNEAINKVSLVAIVMMLLYIKSISQSLLPDTTSSPAYKNAVAFYNRSLTEELHLFNQKNCTCLTERRTKDTLTSLLKEYPIF